MNEYNTEFETGLARIKKPNRRGRGGRSTHLIDPSGTRLVCRDVEFDRWMPAFPGVTDPDCKICIKKSSL